jgi:hypothetical protein
VKYFAKVECFPHVNLEGEHVEADADLTVYKTPSRGKDKKNPKANMGMDTKADKEEDLNRKIRQLVDCGVPFDAVAEVLDVSADRVMTVINEQASSMKTEHIDIIWNHPFQFLLADPSKAEVGIQVMKTEPGMEEQVVGKLHYKVSDLVQAEQLTAELREPLLECSDSKTKIKVKFQLRTLYLGPQYPVRVANPKPALDPAVMRAAAKKRQKQRYVYLDRMGTAKTQVNGMWMKAKDTTSKSHSFKETMGSWAHKEVEVLSGGAHRASEMMHAMGNKIGHMFHRDATGERANLRGSPSAPAPGT